MTLPFVQTGPQIAARAMHEDVRARGGASARSGGTALKDDLCSTGVDTVSFFVLKLTRL